MNLDIRKSQPEGKLPPFKWGRPKEAERPQPESTAKQTDVVGEPIYDQELDRSAAEAVAKEQKMEDEAQQIWAAREAEKTLGGATGEVERDFLQEKIDRGIDRAVRVEGTIDRAKESAAQQREVSERKFALEKEIRVTQEVLAGLSKLPWKDRARKNALHEKFRELQAQKTRARFDRAIDQGEESDARSVLTGLEEEYKATSRWNIFKRRELKGRIAKQRQEVNRMAVWSTVRKELPHREGLGRYRGS